MVSGKGFLRITGSRISSLAMSAGIWLIIPHHIEVPANVEGLTLKLLQSSKKYLSVESYHGLARVLACILDFPLITMLNILFSIVALFSTLLLKW